MSAMQRTKGAQAERELAGILRDLLGYDVRRRVRNHAGDSDLVGIPGWSIESKRYKSAGRAEIAAWWRQTVEQATSGCPVLFYRLDRADWRAVWPLSVTLADQRAEMWRAYEWTVEGTVQAWAAVAREVSSGS